MFSSCHQNRVPCIRPHRKTLATVAVADSSYERFHEYVDAVKYSLELIGPEVTQSLLFAQPFQSQIVRTSDIALVYPFGYFEQLAVLGLQTESIAVSFLFGYLAAEARLSDNAAHEVEYLLNFFYGQYSVAICAQPEFSPVRCQRFPDSLGHLSLQSVQSPQRAVRRGDTTGDV